MQTTVPQDLRGQVVNGQSSFKVRHSYERQPAKDKRTCWSGSQFSILGWLQSKQCIDVYGDIGTTGDIHAKKLKTAFSHSRFTESHRFHWIRFFFVFVSVHRKWSDHLYEHKQKQADEACFHPHSRLQIQWSPPCLWRCLWAWRNRPRNPSAPKCHPCYTPGTLAPPDGHPDLIQKQQRIHLKYFLWFIKWTNALLKAFLSYVNISTIQDLPLITWIVFPCFKSHTRTVPSS